MKVTKILQLKGHTLYTIQPDQSLVEALNVMVDKDLGSLVVMEHGDLVGMLTFRELNRQLVKNGGSLGTTLVRTAMDDHPITCTLQTELDEVRRIMLANHARYIPVMDGKVLHGVISFYDVAKTVVEMQNFENQMLKAYIRDWPGKDPEDVGEE